MNYIQYLQEGGLPTKEVQMDSRLGIGKGYLVTDDWKKVYESIKSIIDKFKKDKSVATEDISGIVVGVKNGIGYFGNSIPSFNNNHYVRIDSETDAESLPSWIQLRS